MSSTNCDTLQQPDLSCHLETTTAVAAACSSGVRSSSSYLCDVRLGTKTGINAPSSSALANKLSVEVWIHFYEQPRPATFSLQVEGV